MDSVSKAARAIIPQAVKRTSRKAKRSQGVIKPKKILGETITLVRPNMHVRSPPLTPGVKSLLEKELFKAEIKATEPMTSLQPQEITEHLIPSLESFFNKRPYTLKHFNEFLMVLSHQGKVDEAFNVVEKMKPSTVSFIYLIRACAKSKDVETAEKLFDTAVATCGENLLGSLYSTLISVYAVKGNVDYIDALMQEKRRKGYTLTVIDYTCKMHALLIAKKPKAVIALYQELKNEITPDEFLMTTVLKACASNSEAEMALTVWDDIKEFSPLDSCSPYNELIMALGKRKDYAERAVEIWREMRGNGIVPDQRTYNAVLTACTRLGDLILAKEIVTDMKMNMISMDSVRYCLLIQVYGEATIRADETKRNMCIQDSWELFHQYENSGGKVDAMVLNSLLGVHIKALREHEVEGLILPMFETYHVQKTLHTYRHLIVFYKNLRNPVQVYQIWETMKTEGVTPDFYVMNAYLETAYRFNDSDKVVESLQALKKQDRMPLYYIMKRLNSQKNLPRRVWVELQEFNHFYSSLVQSKFGLQYIPDDVMERASR